MLACYYSGNSGISPLFKEARYVFRQVGKIFRSRRRDGRTNIMRWMKQLKHAHTYTGKSIKIRNEVIAR